MNSAGTVLIDEAGFCLPGGVRVLWSSIRRICAFKKDLITSDEAFLSFENDTAPEYVEVSEEVPGFGEFRLEVENRFSFPVGWWEAVLKPAFARNESVLYVRMDAQPGAPGDAPKAARP
jgi:hypothetical protein